MRKSSTIILGHHHHLGKKDAATISTKAKNFGGAHNPQTTDLA